MKKKRKKERTSISRQEWAHQCEMETRHKMNIKQAHYECNKTLELLFLDRLIKLKVQLNVPMH